MIDLSLYKNISHDYFFQIPTWKIGRDPNPVPVPTPVWNQRHFSLIFVIGYVKGLSDPYPHFFKRSQKQENEKLWWRFLRKNLLKPERYTYAISTWNIKIGCMITHYWKITFLEHLRWPYYYFQKWVRKFLLSLKFLFWRRKKFVKLYTTFFKFDLKCFKLTTTTINVYVSILYTLTGFLL